MRSYDELGIEELRDLGYTEEEIQFLYSWSNLTQKELNELLRSDNDDEKRRGLRHIRLFPSDTSKEVIQSIMQLANAPSQLSDDTRGVLLDALHALKIDTPAG